MSVDYNSGLQDGLRLAAAIAAEMPDMTQVEHRPGRPVLHITVPRMVAKRIRMEVGTVANGLSIEQEDAVDSELEGER